MLIPLASPRAFGRVLVFCAATVAAHFTAVAAESAAPNTLTPAEKADGWVLLWDGHTTQGWRSFRSDAFPTKGWKIHDGVLTVLSAKGAEGGAGGDIITQDRYSDFELTLEFKLTRGANSGIKFFVQPALGTLKKQEGKAPVGSAVGLEFQVLDDDVHPDAKAGKNGNRTIGSLYDLIPAPKDKQVRPIGEWNRARIVSKGKHMEFYLNGVKTVEFDRGSPEFRQAVAESKFNGVKNFGEWADGHILLQEHGNEVSFRDIKLRKP